MRLNFGLVLAVLGAASSVIAHGDHGDHGVGILDARSQEQKRERGLRTHRKLARQYPGSGMGYDSYRGYGGGNNGNHGHGSNHGNNGNNGNNENNWHSRNNGNGNGNGHNGNNGNGPTKTSSTTSSTNKTSSTTSKTASTTSKAVSTTSKAASTTSKAASTASKSASTTSKAPSTPPSVVPSVTPSTPASVSTTDRGVTTSAIPPVTTPPIITPSIDPGVTTTTGGVVTSTTDPGVTTTTHVGVTTTDAGVTTTTDAPVTTTSEPAVTTTTDASATTTTDIPVTTTTEAPVTTTTEAPVTTTTDPAVTTSVDPSVTTSVDASVTSAPASTTTTGTPTPTSVIAGATVDNKVLIIARDAGGVETGAHGLHGYGIPFEDLQVPSGGASLPALTSSPTHGRYSAIVIVDGVSYEYATGWASAITTAQWEELWAYQIAFGVRMVRINEYPGPLFGATALGGCCGYGIEQFVSISDASDFPSANLKVGAEVSSQGLWHYPAEITDSATTKAVAQFAAGGGFASSSVAAVINNFGGREQFVWFMSWAPEWSNSCALLQHAHIHWMTRGVFLGKRKIHLSPQIDDLELATDMYYPAGTTFRVRTSDLDGHVAWQQDLNSRLPAGSSFKLELGHNGNGDFEYILGNVNTPPAVCSPGEPVYTEERADTELEFMKPLGTGSDAWPAGYNTYSWSLTCAKLDPLTNWYQNPSNRDAFNHVSHTFTHYELNNATYADAAKEIQFNRAWMDQTGISAGQFSPHGLIPPAITGLHNGDVIKAWLDNGITHVVGDNTRPVLRNPVSQYWPLISTVASNGYDGLVIVPRWATSIYYNCDTFECDVAEWIAISSGAGDYTNLLDNAKTVNVAYLLALKADPYMFHQANMRQSDMPTITVGSKTGKMSLVMAWVETIAQELARLTNWPIVSLKHDDVAAYFLDRMALDQCEPSMSYGLNAAGTAITQVTVSASNPSCSVPVPVTIPSGSASASGGSVSSEVVGSEPPIQWVSLAGGPVTLTLSSPVNL